jgi:hypothetical protein
MTPQLLAEIQKAMIFDHHGPYTITEELKRTTIVEYGQRHNCDLFIETGTNQGDTVNIVKTFFRDTYSIELGPKLHQAAVQRFKNDSNVHLLCGDSSEVLSALLPALDTNRKIVFYLDAHSRYDETSPVGQGVGTSAPREIQVIATLRPNSIVLIDDARLFTHQYNTDWPQLDNFIRDIENFQLWGVDLESDMIRLVPLQ